MSRYTPLELAEAFIKTGEIDDAREALDAHLDENPDDQDVMRMRAEVLMRFNDAQVWQLALTDFEHIHELTAPDILRYSVLLEKLAQSEQAKVVLRQGVERFPDDVRLLERYIHFLQQCGDYAEALQILAQQSPNWRWSQWQADILREQGNYAEAVSTYSETLAQLEAHITGMDRHWAESLQARLLLARVHCALQLGDDKSAEADVKVVKSLVSDEPMLDFYQGLIHHKRGKHQDALMTIQNAFAQASDAIKAQMWQELSAHDTLYQQVKQAINI